MKFRNPLSDISFFLMSNSGKNLIVVSVFCSMHLLFFSVDVCCGNVWFTCGAKADHSVPLVGFLGIVLRQVVCKKSFASYEKTVATFFLLLQTWSTLELICSNISDMFLLSKTSRPSLYLIFCTHLKTIFVIPV